MREKMLIMMKIPLFLFILSHFSYHQSFFTRVRVNQNWSPPCCILNPLPVFFSLPPKMMTMMLLPLSLPPHLPSSSFSLLFFHDDDAGSRIRSSASWWWWDSRDSPEKQQHLKQGTLDRHHRLGRDETENRQNLHPPIYSIRSFSQIESLSLSLKQCLEFLIGSQLKLISYSLDLLFLFPPNHQANLDSI